MARRRIQREIPPAEWVAGALGLALVLATIGFLGFEIFEGNDREPALTLTVVRVHEVAGSFVVDVVVQNASRAAASDVHLAARAVAPDGRETESQARVQHVPGRSSQHASLVFDFDPGSAPAVRIVGYAMP